MQIGSTRKKTAHFLDILRGIKQHTIPLQNLFNKFNNDWDMNAASGLAYNLISAIVPMAIAIIAIFGLTVGNLDASANQQLLMHIQQIFPGTLSTTGILGIALKSLSMHAGILGILAVLASIFGGSRLFISIEGYFDIIYRTAPRNIIQQNLMALIMMVVFLILLPLIVFSSSAPALLRSLSEIPIINQIPGVVQLTNNAFFIGFVAIVTGLIVGWILFESIYMVVPPMRLSFKHSWRGAAVAALGLEIFLSLFPFYITRFMGSYIGTAGFVLILLVFFYYFAVILLIGAEINAYFSLGIGPLPNNIAVVLRDATRQKTEEEMHLAKVAEEDEGETPSQEVDEASTHESHEQEQSLSEKSAEQESLDTQNELEHASSQGVSANN